jgi:hypothetical protein
MITRGPSGRLRGGHSDLISSLILIKLKHAREDMPALRNDLPAPGLVEPEVAIAAGQAFDRPDDPALEARLVLVGVAELIEAHGDSRRMTMSLRMPRLHESHVTTGAAWFGLPRRKGIRRRAKPSPPSCAERLVAWLPRPVAQSADENDRHLGDRMLADLVVDLLVAQVGLDLSPASFSFLATSTA